MSNTTALMDLLFAGTRQRALAVLLLQPGEGFHLRELARLTASNAGTLMRELDKLTEAGLVLRSEHGNQVRYQANRACPMFEDLAAIFRKTHGAAAVLREALSPLASKIQVALVFGSVARGAQSSGSDIDLLVVGEAGFAELVQALYPAQQTLGREINPVLYSPAEFVQRAGRGEAFVREITGKPVVFLMGDKDDLAELAGNAPAATARR
ncbi:nucleotidyltransferase domain-containing protein [Thermomonas sp.]|jgi:predicted nucleotidyltransferase|uniref:nucleotidyltransferase domain-containing protein n=1 Tax=Thermomonas sp. TaxID=1971895 RepID=UPI001B40EE26|nr:nucleotidyltransferase domain-containing protein [Thermomonas sp.]MBK6333982.1 nucleotidyltransferase domain-containing protein [Thermomonas sp.]MBK7205402.1 nucleotidyltransferase domain-containing protein [Thermomonas sp.]MBL0228938.1 nucleotidyltransferase domain-containing protein [Thermomonas sp.]MBP9930782.1 nucleotidyltransferase domain-containing protein [Rhodoferax sp.]